MARAKRRSSTSTVSANNPAGSTAIAAKISKAQQLNLDYVRSIVTSSLTTSQGFLKMVDEMQQAHVKTLQRLSQSLNGAIEQTQHVQDLREFISMQVGLTRENLAHVAQNYGSLAVRLAKIEAQLVEKAQGRAADRSRILLGSVAVRGAGDSAKR